MVGANARAYLILVYSKFAPGCHTSVKGEKHNLANISSRTLTRSSSISFVTTKAYIVLTMDSE